MTRRPITIAAETRSVSGVVCVIYILGDIETTGHSQDGLGSVQLHLAVD